MQNANHIMNKLLFGVLRMINVKAMRNVLLQETQAKGYAKPKQILLVDFASETVIVAGTFWRSAKIGNVPKSFQVKIDQHFCK